MEANQSMNISNKDFDSFQLSLRPWKELLLPLNSILHWEKPHYPVAIISAVTGIFVLIWHFQPSVLTTFSILALVIFLTNNVVPLIASSLSPSQVWSERQELQFDRISRRIWNLTVHCHNLRTWFEQLQVDNPKMYITAVSTILIVCAWVGMVIDNLLLVYAITLCLLLLPGLRHRGIFQQATGKLSAWVKNYLSKLSESTKKK